MPFNSNIMFQPVAMLKILVVSGIDGRDMGSGISGVDFCVVAAIAVVNIAGR